MSEPKIEYKDIKAGEANTFTRVSTLKLPDRFCVCHFCREGYINDTFASQIICPVCQSLCVNFHDLADASRFLTSLKRQPHG